MVPTPRGVVVLTLGISLFAFGWLTRIGWLYVADSLIWGILLVNLLVPRGMLHGLHASRMASSAPSRQITSFEDDPVTVGITLENRGLFPKLFVVLREASPLAGPGQDTMEFLFDVLGPKARVQTTYTVQCYRRGVYHFPGLEACTTAPFGLFSARRSLPAPLEVAVYPPALPIRATARGGLLPGNLSQTSPPRPTGEIRGSRAYQAGDHPRAIHWRNSARHGQLMVKEMDEAPLGEVRLVLNPTLDLGTGRDTTVEYAVKIAASLTKACLEDGRPFRLFASRHEVSFASLRSGLDYLARLGPVAERWSPPTFGPQASGTTIFAVSAADISTFDAITGTARLRGRTLAVVFESFGPDEDPAVGPALAQRGVTVIPCRPGELSEALARLGLALFAGPATGPNASRGLA